MARLSGDQAQFMAVLQQGPAAYPQGLFTGEADRALLGLKAHANTISHARLIAIEHTFPGTLQHMGKAEFNALSREYIELPDVRTAKLMRIGEGFAAFLSSSGCDAGLIDLARVEWAWLESYHAAEGRALGLADLAGYDEAALLDMPVVLHPATRLVAVSGMTSEMLADLGLPEGASGSAVLVTRPDAEVRFTLLGDAQAALAGVAENSGSMRNLLTAALETASEAEALPAVFALIEAGMLASPGGPTHT
jgi:hypothetical protein